MENYTKFNTRVELWPYEKMSKLKPVSINRDTESRLVKVTKRLEKKYLPTHSVVYVGKALKSFGSYKKNEYFRLDANTRSDVYSVKPDLIPPIPFTVIMFDFDNMDDVKDVYYSIDSQDAVENSSDKMTGLLRDKMYKPKSKLIQKGMFKRALDLACQYGHDKDGTYLHTSKHDVKLEHYWDELVYLDKFVIDNKDARYSPNVFGCFLMIAKKYGLKNKRLRLLIENFKNGITTINNSKEVDGIHYVYHNLYDKKKDTWKLSTWGSARDVVGPMLYCFDKFMNGENISKSTKFPNENFLNEFFQFYNERK